MVGVIKRFFDCQYMNKAVPLAGALPSTRDIYMRTFDIAWPSAVESVLVALVGMIDTMMVGSIGPEAIAAVGITNQPKMIFLSMIFSLNVGVTAIVARKKGEENREGANSVLRQAVMICAIIALLTSVLGVVFAREIILLAGAGSDIIDDATAYFRIIMAGIFFNDMLLTINAAQRGIGKTRISMVTNLTANGVNIIFNYLLIGGNLGFPRLGVRGAAIATVLGFIVGFLMSLRSVTHHEQFLFLFSHGKWRFERETLGSMWRVGSSSLVEQLCLRVGFFTYAKIVASLGTIAFATHQICMNILSLSFSFGDGLSVAASSLVGQSLGAKRQDLAIIYGKVCQRIGLCISLGLMVLFFVFRRYMMMAYTTDAEIIRMGMDIIIIIGFTTTLQISQVVIMGCLRGAGDTKFAAIVSLISIGIVRPGSAWFFCYPLSLGVFGAWISVFFDQCMRMLLSYWRFSRGNWTKLKL